MSAEGNGVNSVPQEGVTEQTPVVSEKVEQNGESNAESMDSQETTTTPSKKSLKKMEKRLKYEAIKKLKRKAEKEKMRVKRLAARENGTLMPIPRKQLIKTVQPIDYSAHTARVAIDLSFDDKMVTNEKTRTCKQLLRVYTLNRRSPKPMPVYFCGMQPGSELFQIFEKNDGYQHWDVHITPKTIFEEFPKEKIVYLTSESDNTLEELSPDDVYVIGGMVDHNRYKGLCHEIAEKQGVRHARLPIKENVDMKTRTILTIEQVFDMISRVYNGSDWTSTLLEVIPKRKNAKPRIEVQKVTFKSESKPALDSSDVQDEKPPVSKETSDSSTSTLTM